MIRPPKIVHTLQAVELSDVDFLRKALPWVGDAHLRALAEYEEQFVNLPSVVTSMRSIGTKYGVCFRYLAFLRRWLRRAFALQDGRIGNAVTYNYDLYHYCLGCGVRYPKDCYRCDYCGQTLKTGKIKNGD